MTTYTEKTAGPTTWPMFAALGAGLSLVLTAIGTFWDITGNETGGGEGLTEYLIVVAVIGAATAVVFGLVVRTARPTNQVRTSLVLAVAGLLSVVMFSLGLPTVLAAGAACLAVQSATQEGRTRPTAKASLAIAAATVVLAVFAAVAG